MPRPLPLGLQRRRSRHGKWSWIVRLKKGKRYPVHGDFGTAEFHQSYAEAYQKAVNGLPKAIQAPFQHKGSLAWLVDLWKDSSDYRLTAKATQVQRDNILKRIMADNPGLKFANITEADIEAGRERRMDRPAAANNYLKTMRALFGWAKKAKLIDVDPAKPVTFLPNKTKGHTPWTMADVEAFRARWEVGTRERLAMEFLLWTGLRRGDAVRLGRQHERGGMWHIEAEKTGAMLHVLILEPLAQIIEASPKGQLVYLTSPGGNAWTKAHFGNWFRVACDKAGIRGKSAHGLRKLSATVLANEGGSELEMQAHYGWQTNQQSATYTKQANAIRLARMAGEKLLKGLK